MRFPAISTVLCPPPAGAPGRSPVGVWRIRVNAVRRARPSGIGAPFPVLSPPSDLLIGVLTCDSTQAIQDATSSSRHYQEPPGTRPHLCHHKKPQSGCQVSRKESAGNRSNGTVRHRLLGPGLSERIESASQGDMRRGRAANRLGARRVLMLSVTSSTGGGAWVTQGRHTAACSHFLRRTGGKGFATFHHR